MCVLFMIENNKVNSYKYVFLQFFIKVSFLVNKTC